MTFIKNKHYIALFEMSTYLASDINDTENFIAKIAIDIII